MQQNKILAEGAGAKSKAAILLVILKVKILRKQKLKV